MPWDNLVSPLIADVAEYWENLRNDREMPARADLDPLQMKAQWLPYLSTVELHHGPFRIRYRVVGTEVARHTGGDFTGKWLHETDWGEASQRANLALYARLVERRAPIGGISGLSALVSPERPFEWALFPLSDDGATITHCLSVDDVTTLGRRTKLSGLDTKTLER